MSSLVPRRQNSRSQWADPRARFPRRRRQSRSTACRSSKHAERAFSRPSFPFDYQPRPESYTREGGVAVADPTSIGYPRGGSMDTMRRCRIFVTALLVAAATAGVSLMAGQSQSTASKTKPSSGSWTPARTAWGDPDLQGKWLVAETATPLERPKELGKREFLTDQEIAKSLANYKSQPAPDDRDAELVRQKQPEDEKGIRG